MKKYCIDCGTESESILKTQTEDIIVKNTKITITATVRYCGNCGAALWDDKIDDNNLCKAFNEYRRMKGLLFPEQIKKIRCKYALTQEEFSRFLGFEKNAIARFENGSLQTEAQNDLILSTAIPSNFKKPRHKKTFTAQFNRKNSLGK